MRAAVSGCRQPPGLSGQRVSPCACAAAHGGRAVSGGCAPSACRAGLDAAAGHPADAPSRCPGPWLGRCGSGPGAAECESHTDGAGRPAAGELDLDATAALCGKRPARRTCLGQRGWMPMVGRIAATGPVAASDFRRGNRPPNDDNSGFIKRCIRALPPGVKVTRVRIDAAGWSKPVIRHCQDHGIGCAIRARSGARCSDPAPPERRGR